MWGQTMKKILFSLLLVLVLASSAFATLTVSDITLGDDGAVRNNPLADDVEDELGDLESTTVVITNTGNTTVSNITLSFGALVEKFGLSYDTTPFSLNENASKSVSISGRIPDNWGSVQVDEDESRSILAGTFSVLADGTSVAQGNFSAQAEPGITVNDIEVIIDGEIYDLDDDELEEIIPGASVSFRFTVTNEFDRDSNIEMEVDIDVDSSNRDFDLDDSSDNFDLKEDDEETFSTGFDIDWRDVDDGDDTRVTVQIDAVDDNGAVHTIEFEFSLESQYPEADIEVGEVIYSPASVCTGGLVDISFEVENIGEDDQDIRTQIQQATFGWNSIKGPVEIDGRDDERTESEIFQESLRVPTSVIPGEYPVRVTVYYEDEDGDDVSDFRQIIVTVRDCAATTQQNTTQGVVIVQPQVNQTAGQTTSTPSTVVATAKPKNDTLFIVGLAVLALLLIAVLVSLILILRR